MPATVGPGSKAAQVVADPLPMSAPHPDAWPRLVAALEAFRAHGDRAARGIAHLESLLARRAALPLDAFEEDRALAARFLRYRYGPVSPPQASIRDLVVEGWGKAVACRLAYRQLTPLERLHADATYGPFTDAQRSDRPLWLLGFPAENLAALDRHAASVGLDPMGRMRGKDDADTQKKVRR